MIQSIAKPNQMTAEVLQLLGDFMSAKQKYSLLKCWINLKNHGISKNARTQCQNTQNSRTLSVTESSEYACCQIISPQIHQSNQECKQTYTSNCRQAQQQYKYKTDEMQFEDMVIDKIFYLEALVHEMKESLYRKQLQIVPTRAENKDKITNRIISCDLLLQTGQNFKERSSFSKANNFFKQQIQRNSMNSDFFSKSEILGQMFDDQTESVKNMIQAIKQRQPSIIRDNKKTWARSPLQSQAEFDSYQNTCYKRFASADEDTMSDPGFKNKQFLSVSDFCQGMQKIKQNYQSKAEIQKQGKKPPRFSAQIKNNKNQNLNDFSFDASQQTNTKVRIPKPNFRKQKEQNQKALHKLTQGRSERGLKQRQF